MINDIPTPAQLVDSGICPTCYNKEHGNIIYGDIEEKLLYRNELFECFLAGNPRAPGHTIISSIAHYKDMMAIPEDLCSEVFAFAQRAMRAIREVYGAESVYLCTMCDGPMNHFHLQLIPRYAYEQRGSHNFVKPRQNYVPEEEKIACLREMIP